MPSMKKNNSKLLPRKISLPPPRLGSGYGLTLGSGAIFLRGSCPRTSVIGWDLLNQKIKISIDKYFIFIPLPSHEKQL